MPRILSWLTILVTVTVLAGCSGGDNPLIQPVDRTEGSMSAVAPADLSSTLSQGVPSPDSMGLDNPFDHQLWGIWRVRLYKDGTFEIIPRRTEEIHANVTNVVKNCPTCLQIHLAAPPVDDIYEFNITLTNPTSLTGYDVTAIIRGYGDIILQNPDSYTFLYSHAGDSTPNPFTAWATGVTNRAFAAHASLTETMRFHFGGFTKWVELDYVIQASYPANQEEPYGIFEMTASGDLKSDSSNQVDLQCRVGDWQNNVDNVKIDLSPLGGPADSSMFFITGDIWKLPAVVYNPSGQGPGDHRLKITATSAGVSTWNYLPVTVTKVGPIEQGSFEIAVQNRPLIAPGGPTDGMDIAVTGALDGTSVTMVFGGDDTYHFWVGDYTDGSFGLYTADSGDPITPFDLPNSRFDFADQEIPDTSVDSIFTMSWGESNTSPATLDSSTIPPVMAVERFALWFLDQGNLRLTSNVLVIGTDEGPPKTFQVIVKPLEFASGFRKDGLLYTAMAFAAGDESKFPVVAVMALHPPLDFANNSTLITDGYEADLVEGSGPGVVNRDAMVGLDVDDTGIMEISGGYGGHAWITVVEAGSENALEIVDADIDAPKNTFKTVALPSAPKDVEILPLKNAGQPGNLIAVLCADNKIRLYDYEGALIETIGGAPYMTGSALRLDIDDQNLAIHVLHQGASSPLVTVYKWVG